MLFLGAPKQFIIFGSIAMDVCKVIIKKFTNSMSLFIKSKIDLFSSAYLKEVKVADWIVKHCVRFGRVALCLCEDIDAIEFNKLS